MERGLRVLGRVLAPQGVDQAVAGDDLARVEQQVGDQRLLTRAPEAQRKVPPPSVQGPEDTELEAVGQSATLPPRQPVVSALSGHSATVAPMPTTNGRTFPMSRALLVPLAAAAAALTAAAPALATYPGANGRLAFQRPVGDQVDLFTIRPDGTHAARVLRSRVIEERPSWSPDGERLAFARDTAGGATEIFTAAPDGGGLRQVTRWGGVAGTPTWTPDGRIVAFTLKDFPPAASDNDPPPPSELYAIGADGTGELRLTTDTTIQTDPDVSPADGTIAFTQWQAVAGQPNVFDLGIGAIAAGGPTSTLAPYKQSRDAFNPSWSPDGRRIVFEIATGTPPRTGSRDRQSDLVVMNADGSGLTRLTRTGALEATPVWSPDGRRIAFASDRHVKRGPRERLGRDFELYVMRADGTHVRRLTRNRVPDLYPNWQALPDR